MSQAPRDRTPTDDAAAVWSARRTSFGSEADAYALGRPTYPPEALRWALPDDVHLVLDLAAGTGRLTEGLLAHGVDVVAVEPLAEMRAHIPAPAHALDGTAEAIPLDDASVDAVTVGHAFHWFDVPRATAEIRRVLRIGGTVGLFWNLLDDRDALVAALADLLKAVDRLSNLREDQKPPYAGVEGMGMPHRRLFRHAVRYDADRLAALVLSFSQTILLADDDRAALLDDVWRLAPAGNFDLPLVCETWRGERLG